MHAWQTMLVAALALALGVNAAMAREGKTSGDLALRAGPGAKYELLLTVPAGADVTVGPCAHGWCKVAWNSYSGYANQGGLEVQKVSGASPTEGVEPVTPVYPRYPYHSGHYPTADAYYDLPPYADIRPSWYRGRYFLTLREHGRYRYVPYVFTRNNYKAP
jgi:uncharacterized protein YraI